LNNSSVDLAISPTVEIIAELRAGRMVVLVDEEDRENEGDLVVAAEFATPEVINFMARFGRGLICLTLTEERCRQLNLPLMVSNNRSPMGTNFTLSIEAAEGVTTGISAADRARTVQAAIRPAAGPADIIQPGHIFPLMAQNGGTLVRAGHTEAGCDLARLAGVMPAAVICEILKDDGEMARLPDLVPFAAHHQLKIGTITDLIQYRSSHESLVSRATERDIETSHGSFRLVAYTETAGQHTLLALVKGHFSANDAVLVRVHEPVSLIDVLDIRGTRHSWNLNDAMSAVAKAGSGVIVLLHRPETAAELLARAQPQQGSRPHNMVLRNYGIGAQILRDLGVKKMRVMTQPLRMPSMAGFDLEVTEYLQPPNQSKSNKVS
jgi:3,4-dihydroxy 2-butanone 4-phosphate synthase/GTP cyclohydrolase II